MRHIISITNTTLDPFARPYMSCLPSYFTALFVARTPSHRYVTIPFSLKWYETWKSVTVLSNEVVQGIPDTITKILDGRMCHLSHFCRTERWWEDKHRKAPHISALRSERNGVSVAYHRNGRKVSEFERRLTYSTHVAAPKGVIPRTVGFVESPKSE